MTGCLQMQTNIRVAYAVAVVLFFSGTSFTAHAQEKGSIVLVHFDKIGVLEASNLTKDERAAVITSVKKKFEGTDVTIVDNWDDFGKETKAHPEKTAHKIYVNSLSSGSAGHARHCGDNGKVYDSKYIDKDRNPRFDDLRKDPKDPKSPLDSGKLINAVENTVAHEIGHLLGLDDDKDAKAAAHIMKSPISIGEDVNPLSFTDKDKATIKNGKTKVSAPNPEPKKREISFVRGAYEPGLPTGFFERTDWVPVSYQVSLPGEYAVGYINALSGFYPLSDSLTDSGLFDFAPSVPFDLALERLSDLSIFTLSDDAVDVLFNGALNGLFDARFPFNDNYYSQARILFDTSGDGTEDVSLLLNSWDTSARNGIASGRVPYAPALETIPEPSTLFLILVGMGALYSLNVGRKWLA